LYSHIFLYISDLKSLRSRNCMVMLYFIIYLNKQQLCNTVLKY